MITQEEQERDAGEKDVYNILHNLMADKQNWVGGCPDG